MALNISIFTGGYQTTTPDHTIDSWDEFVDLVSQVSPGPKNGDYFVRGRIDGQRCDDNLATYDLLVIDGDQSLNNGGSCIPPQDVHRVLREANITHVIYSSYSNDIVNNKHKFRLVVPAENVCDADTLAQGVREILSTLHAHGCPVRNVKENLVPSQPWFTPRCPEGLEDDFYAAWHDGRRYAITGSLNVLPTTAVGYQTDKPTATKSAANTGGEFSWSSVQEQFIAGTLHQGLKSAIGWCIYTTDWADSQIKQMMLSLVELCPDEKKRKRAQTTKEIDDLIKYCRKKAGADLTGQAHTTNWKDHHITANTLKDKEFPPVRWAVDDLIPEGLTVFAGDPKVGKSLVAVDICSAIASGEQAFATQTCVCGTVVYASLEDPERRVQARIRTQTDIWPDKFHLVTGGVSKVGPDFYAMLDEWLLLWSDMRAIIIDTMQFIIPEKPANQSDYEFYYHILDPLHKWALNNHIALILITHKNKAKKQLEDNPFAGVMGSVAIQGTADAMLLLSKNHSKAQDPTNISIADGFLDVTGRDIGQARFSLDFDEEAYRWSLRDKVDGQETTGNANWLVVRATIEHKPLQLGEIAVAARLNKNTVRSILQRMRRQGLVEYTGAAWAIPGQDYSENSKSWG